MAKLEGFSKVAVVKYGCCQTPYFFAIYDDGTDYKVGDMCLFSGSSTPAKLVEVISVEEAAKRSSKNITAEVIGRVDTSSFTLLNASSLHSLAKSIISSGFKI